MTRIATAFYAIVFLLVLASCGGGGGGGGGSDSAATSAAKAITAFTISGAAGKIDEITKSIQVHLPLGTNVSALTASFQTSGSSVSVGGTTQVSGINTNDFSSPVTYMVTAADGSTSSYIITVHAGWVIDGLLNRFRIMPTATRLSDGRVIVAGGDSAGCGGSLTAAESAEIYDPATSVWSDTPMTNVRRYGHTANLLPNGKVLVTGCENIYGGPELYDPVTNSWGTLASLGFSLLKGHTTTLLPNGKVLLIGGSETVQGFPGGVYHTSIHSFDTATNQWSVAGSLLAARAEHTATLLPDGKVLITGGRVPPGTVTKSAEIFDPVTGVSTATAAMSMVRYMHRAILLPNGTVLVSGGVGGLVGAVVQASAEIYDPNTGLWTATGSMATPSQSHTMTLLPAGKVLAVPYNTVWTASCTAEQYDPVTGIWSASGVISDQDICNNVGTATLLNSGKVLMTGGRSAALFY